MNSFLINNCNSQHADTVAQGTNSQSFHIPCATAPQIVANRYVTSRHKAHMNLSQFLMLVFFCFFVSACYQSSKEAVLEDNIASVRSAFKKVSDSLNIVIKTGYTSYSILVSSNLQTRSYNFDSTDYVVQIPISKTMMQSYDISTVGVIQFQPLDVNTTLYKSTFTSPSGDTKSYCNFFYELTRQQLLLDKNKITLAQNDYKSKNTFYKYNMLSTTWAYYYVQKDNPLISKKTRTLNFFGTAFLDVMCYMPVVAIPLSKSKDRIALVNLAILSNLLYKYLNAGFSADIEMYNKFSRSHYDLKRIKE